MGKILTTPAGVAFYPHVVTPNTKFDENGVFDCKLHVSEGDYNSFELKVNDIVNAAYEAECAKQGKKKLKVFEKKPLRVNDDGDFEIYAKQKHKILTSKGETLVFSVALYDSTGQKISDEPKIGSGSRLRLGVEVAPYYTDMIGFGYTLRLKAVQLLDLKEYSGKFGFTSEEDGYVGTGESFDETFETEEKEVAPF